MKREQRKNLIQIRVSDSEKQAILLNAKGNVSGWLRDLGLHTPRPTYTELKQDPELVAALHKIGSNINQLTRVVNTKIKSGDALELTSILAQLEHSNALLTELTKQGL